MLARRWLRAYVVVCFEERPCGDAQEFKVPAGMRAWVPHKSWALLQF